MSAGKWEWKRVFTRWLFVLWHLLGAGSAAALAAEPSAPVDPATQVIAALSAEEARACRKLFEQLSSEDFDIREQALNGLVAKGTAVLPLAQEYAKHGDTEIAKQAKGLHQKVLLNYDGYLPMDLGLKAALAKKVKFPPNGKDVVEWVRKVAEEADVTVLFDPAAKPGQGLAIVDMPDKTAFSDPTAGSVLHFLTRCLGLAGVPRGGVYLITFPETAQRLATQRHTFDWSALQLSRDEAERVGKVFQSFFPPVSTELHTGSEVFTVRGAEDCIPHPLAAIVQLRKQGHAVCVVAGPRADGEGCVEPPFPSELSGASPMSLKLRELPLGLVLRWLERRAKFPAEQQADLVLGFEAGPAGRLQLRLQHKSAPALDLFLAGADVTFLYPRGARVGAESDAAALRALLEVIEPHLALFPASNTKRDLAVLRGRMLMQGRYETVTRVLEIIDEWPARNAPPQPPAWQTAIEERLNAKVEWDGRGLSGGRVIPALRKAGEVNILLEDAPDGSVAQFELTPRDAELLAPGKHTLRALLDELCRKANAQWSVELGTVVLTPKTEPPRGTVSF
ncbi:MAG: hypothetical protein NTW87_34385 [Planctomycetota bacterium]|nr:hypothetical protein [Planctomycetota bacterium]